MANSTVIESDRWKKPFGLDRLSCSVAAYYPVWRNEKLESFDDGEVYHFMNPCLLLILNRSGRNLGAFQYDFR